jgi:hypothetical protein
MNTEVNDLSTEQAIWEMTDEELHQFIDDLTAGLYKFYESKDEPIFGDENYRVLLDDCGDSGLYLQSIHHLFLKYLNSGECKLQLGIGPECEQLRSVALRGGTEFAWGKFVYPGMYEIGESLRLQKLVLKCCKVHSICVTRNLGGLNWISHELKYSSLREMTEVERPLRHVKPSSFVKNLYGGQCQKCKSVLQTPAGPIAEAAHIIEVCSDGPDEISNLLCLCPNCHKTLDANAWAPKFEDGNLIAVSYDNSVETKKMLLHRLHQVAPEAIDWRLHQFLVA